VITFQSEVFANAVLSLAGLASTSLITMGPAAHAAAGQTVGRNCQQLQLPDQEQVQRAHKRIHHAFHKRALQEWTASCISWGVLRACTKRCQCEKDKHRANAAPHH
jgi:hypothetical protein